LPYFKYFSNKLPRHGVGDIEGNQELLKTTPAMMTNSAVSVMPTISQEGAAHAAVICSEHSWRKAVWAGYVIA